MNDRLEDIKKRTVPDPIRDYAEVPMKDYQYLIEQAEEWKLHKDTNKLAHVLGFRPDIMSMQLNKQAKRIAELEAELKARPVITPTKYKHIEPFK